MTVLISPFFSYFCCVSLKLKWYSRSAVVHRRKIIRTEKCNKDNIEEENFRVPQDKLQLVTQRDSAEIFKKLFLFAAFYSQRLYFRRHTGSAA